MCTSINSKNMSLSFTAVNSRKAKFCTIILFKYFSRIKGSKVRVKGLRSLHLYQMRCKMKKMTMMTSHHRYYCLNVRLKGINS